MVFHCPVTIKLAITEFTTTCEMQPFIVNALALLTKQFLNLVRGITRPRNIYRVMAGMQTNQMKATPAICYVPAI